MVASIRKRLNKWQVQVRRQGHRPIGHTFTKLADAKVWARQIEAQADQHDLPQDTSQLRDKTLAWLIERYRDTVVPNKRGQEVESFILNAFLRHKIAKEKVAHLTPGKFKAYQTERLKVVKPATICREMGLLQHMFEVARKEWDLPLAINPVAQIKKPEKNNARDRRLAEGEFKALIEACTLCRNPLIEPLIRLAIETGMRRGELLNIRLEHLNPTQRTLLIPHTKNGYPRTIPLSSAALAVLDSLPVNEGEGRLFPLSPSSVNQAWRRLTKRAGIENLHFHDLRHEAISRFFEKGLSIAEVALISGHRDVRQLFRYTHLRAEDLVEKLG